MTIASNHNKTSTRLFFECSKKSQLQILLDAASLIFGYDNYKFMLNCYKEKMEIGLL